MTSPPVSRFEHYARLAAAAALLLGCLLVLRPFLGAMLFAGVLCFSTWPVFLLLKRRLHREWLAATVLVCAMIVAIALPVALAAQSLVVHAADIVEGVRRFLEERGGLTLPAFVRDLPLVGPSLDRYWQLLMQSQSEVVALAKRFADPAKALLAALGGAIGQGLVQILIAIFVAFFFYRDGDRIARLLREAMMRLAGVEHGNALAVTAQNAVKGVVYGLIGTALAQALVAVVGFLIAGVPAAFVLGAATFVLSLVPMGPVLAWGGAAVWLYAQGESGWAIFMVIYGLAVISSVDNFVKPILMSRAGGLSMLLVVLGVFGGAVAFGFIGLFVGPALLAVGWSVLKVWLDTGPEESPPARNP
ncbi:MAG TPA: AI-2E family transporter [Usitatibacter sp.]|nr:AI-2E family transporter [Usitatibacter sp.]